MKISMFNAVFVPGDPDAEGMTFAGAAIELRFGDALVMEWLVTVNASYRFMADENAVDEFVANKFSELFEKAARLPVE